MTTTVAKPRRPRAAGSEPRIDHLAPRDLLAAAKLMYRTADAIRVPAGLPPLGIKVKTTPRLLRHIYDQDTDLSWGAYEGTKLVGFATSHMRDRQWHVSYLFVDPAHQDRGLGTALLRTGLAEAQKRGAHITSQCTFTYNPKAIALYSRLGMFPRKNLLRMEGPPCAQLDRPPAPPSVEPRLIDSTALLSDLNHMDREVRGVNRGVDHCYWLADDDYSGYIFHAGNNAVGYAYISQQGFIAPVLATRDTFLADILTHCLHLLPADSDITPRIWLNGKNFASLTLLLKLGFRINEIAVLMTNRVFCDMRRYVPASLAVF